MIYRTYGNWFNWKAPAPRAKPQPRSPRPYARTAQHIRGRVYRMDRRTEWGGWMWGMEVINTKTGRVIASDDCAIRQTVVDLCDEATAAARAAWFWSFTRKAVS